MVNNFFVQHFLLTKIGIKISKHFNQRLYVTLSVLKYQIYSASVNEKINTSTDKISLNNLSSLALGWVFEEVKITSSTNAVVD